MEHPALHNKALLTIYVLLWTAVSLAVAGAMAPFIPASWGLRLLVGALSGYLFGFLALALWSVIKYADYASQNSWQSMVSHTALATLSVSIWFGTGVLLLYLCVPGNNLIPFVPIIPAELLLGCCFYIIVVLVYKHLQANNTEDEMDDATEETGTVKAQQQPEEIREEIERVAIKNGQKIEVIAIPEIVCVQAEGDYVLIHTAKGRHLKEQTMKYFEEHLPAGQFVRVHRSFIVNVQHISKIELFEKQTQLLTLQNGMQIKASIAGYRLLKQALNL